MGDRANIIVKESDEQVCLYAHWTGSDLPEILRSALKKGESRLNDFQHLTRIIFCEMVGDDKHITGYGITQKPGDGADRIITVDVYEQTIEIKGKTQSISDFVAGEDGW